MKSASLRRTARRATRAGIVTCISTIAITATARAAPHTNLFIAGGQYANSSQSAYLGAILPLPGGTLGKGFFVSPFAGWNRYTFQKNGQSFTGSEPSASVAIGHAWDEPDFNLSLSVAGGYSNTTVTPYAPKGSFHGGQWFAEPEIYAQLKLPAGATATVNGGYLTGMRSYWSSAYLLVPVSPSISIGPEADFGGGINYRSRTYALRVADKLTSSLDVDLSAGATTNLPGPYHPYVALNLSVPFR